MLKTSTKLVTLTVFAALIAAPLARAAGDPPTSSPPVDTSTKSNPVKGKKAKKSSLEDPTSTAAYRTAYDTIYQRNDYSTAIDQLKAMGRDDNASVATLIGYSYRKLGDYKLAQVWYERALKSDPDHVKTWQYYGLWQIEQGNREQAQFHLAKIAQLAGTGSEEYHSLATALERTSASGLVY
jgi:tetratricopeptide (TPR) repeat protein